MTGHKGWFSRGVALILSLGVMALVLVVRPEGLFSQSQK